MIKEELQIVHDKVVELAATYALYIGLYGSRDDVDNCNELSGLGSSLLQRSLQTRMIVEICALTDGPGSGSKENLTILSILKSAACEYGIEINDVQANLNEAIERLRAYRHKMLVHLDKRVALGELKIEPVKTDDLDQSLCAIYETMNFIRLATGETKCVYEFTSIGTAASSITWAVKDSLRMRDLRGRAQAGQISEAAALRLLRVRASRDDEKIIEQY